MNIKSHHISIPGFPRLQLSEAISCTYYTSIDAVIEPLSCLSGIDIFYEYAFHKALEEKPPSDTHFRYVILRENNNIAGLLYFQLKKIDLAASLDGALKEEGDSFKTKVKKKLARKLNFYTLVNGNMMQTGNYGRYFLDTIANHMNLTRLQEIIDFVILQLSQEGFKVAAVLLKDFYENERFTDSHLRKIKYEEFSVQPNMKVNILAHWESAKDYMDDMQSKYRVRTRRTLKKLGDVVKKEIKEEDIKIHLDVMHQLYLSVAEQASFNLFILHKEYFLSLKKHLKDNFKVVAYFLDSKMIGFYTIIYNYHTSDAHFLGYDRDYNRKHHIYHNMLYDLLFDAIENKMGHLDLSRTAMEIKSSIGAKAMPMYLYIKIVNPILNQFTPSMLKFLTPQTSWTERNPFKS